MRHLITCLLALRLLSPMTGAQAPAPVEAAPSVLAQPPKATPEERLAALQRVVDAYVRDRGVPGLSAAVVSADGVVVPVVAGLSRLEPAMPLTIEDRMFSGSIGKIYLAFIALQLVEECKLALDAKLADLIGDRPWFSRLANAETITVRQLMNHTSGVPDHVQSPAFLAAIKKEPQRHWKPDELVEFSLDRPGAPDAGRDGNRAWTYADMNYIILGIVVEKVTGKTYEEELSARILNPFSLKDTVRADRAKLNHLASGYCGANNPFTDKAEVAANGEYFMNPQFEWTGGGIVSTSGDLARWAHILYTAQACKPETIKLMCDDPVPAKTGPGDRYGLGVQLWAWNCGFARGHSGWFPGYASIVAHFPEGNLTIAIMINSDDWKKVTSMSRLICDLYSAARQ